MPELAPAYRNDLEASIGKQLVAAGIRPNYEGRKIEYRVPARDAKYTPDFPIGNIIIECKGNFGGVGRNTSEKEAVRARQKMVLVQQQYPLLDIRFVFQNPNLKLYKGSPTTYAKWAEDHGFKWAAKRLPEHWLHDLKLEQERITHDTHEQSQAQAKRSPRPFPSATARFN